MNDSGNEGKRMKATHAWSMNGFPIRRLEVNTQAMCRTVGYKYTNYTTEKCPSLGTFFPSMTKAICFGLRISTSTSSKLSWAS
jgi:hypothetical protein